MGRVARLIQTHQVNPANDEIKISVLDERGAGGAHHLYLIEGADFYRNASVLVLKEIAEEEPDRDGYALFFQNGPIAEAGVNGLTHEVLLAILIDRLECFQAGQFANDFNQRALESCRDAQQALLDRTRERISRGVEGTHKI